MKKNIAESIRASKLVTAKPHFCYENASYLLELPDFAKAIYVEGAVACRGLLDPIEHGWIVADGEIVDPTLPEMEAEYFPAHEWAGEAYTWAYLKCGGVRPFFRREPFMVNSIEVEMEKARKLASEWIRSRG